MRFRHEMISLIQSLQKIGIHVLHPALNVPKEIETSEMTKQLIIDHFDRIKKANTILILNPHGYIGNSVTIEIGYAQALGKEIIFLERTGLPEIDCLASSFGFTHINRDLSPLY